MSKVYEECNLLDAYFNEYKLLSENHDKNQFDKSIVINCAENLKEEINSVKSFLRNGDEYTPLALAIEFGDIETIEILLNNEDLDINMCYGLMEYNSLALSILKGNKDIIKMLVEHPSIDINKPFIADKWTPLSIKIERSKVNVL
eukprot:TRINITY_DN1505_c1_g1_i2.p1 TRINITY_DN1505_c1_g1~~TRINITY_DN1505_c1_g1_i2.p1  ORF type:complete len:145 (+),score=34.46 TRINITY_DN1505_c1_g1_i2:270-704(+)